MRGPKHFTNLAVKGLNKECVSSDESSMFVTSSESDSGSESESYCPVEARRLTGLRPNSSHDQQGRDVRVVLNIGQNIGMLDVLP